MEYPSNDHKDLPNQHENSHELCNETGHPVVSLTENLMSLMETKTTTWSEFPNGGKIIVEQIVTSDKRNKSKREGLSESQSEIWAGKLTIWVRSFEIEYS